MSCGAKSSINIAQVLQALTDPHQAKLSVLNRLPVFRESQEDANLLSDVCGSPDLRDLGAAAI